MVVFPCTLRLNYIKYTVSIINFLLYEILKIFILYFRLKVYCEIIYNFYSKQRYKYAMHELHDILIKDKITTTHNYVLQF